MRPARPGDGFRQRQRPSAVQTRRETVIFSLLSIHSRTSSFQRCGRQGHWSVGEDGDDSLHSVHQMRQIRQWGLFVFLSFLPWTKIHPYLQVADFPDFGTTGRGSDLQVLFFIIQKNEVILIFFFRSALTWRSSLPLSCRETSSTFAQSVR